ncbi:MAG: penicillin-binding protein 2 [Pseudomonadota bacterium]
MFGRRKPSRKAYSGRDQSLPISRRALVLAGVKLSIAGALAWRMRQLQVVESERYWMLAEENRINMRLIAPARAQLFDRNGAPVAINVKNYRVVMVREQAGDPEEMLERLDRLIGIPDHQRKRILKEMSQKSAFVPVSVAEHLTWEDFAEINANAPALPGITPEVGLSRQYPEGDALTHVVGYVGRVSQQDLDTISGSGREVDPVLHLPEFQIGKTGIERSLDVSLRGKAGNQRIEVNAVGRVIQTLGGTKGEVGADLHLTVDLGLQKYCNERLGDESASAVVMDVRNGDILAAASNPTFDPNPFVLGISHREYNALRDHPRNPLFSKWSGGTYPPGSTFKMIVALAALEAGVVSANDTFFCPGFKKLGNRNYHCWSRGGHGWVGLRKSIRESCDVYYYEIAEKVGIERITAMARRLGLGVEFDLPMTALKTGLMPTKDWKRRVHEEDWLVGDTLNAGIGQGFVHATPISLAVMTARLLTGTALKPRLIRARSGQPVPVEPAEDLGLDPQHLRWMRQGMFDVVNAKRGTAYNVRIKDDEWRMAGKTGTSQVRNITKEERARGVIRNEDLPWNRRDHALFVGYAPVDNPRYVVSVVIAHGGSGSKAAAPVARDILLKVRELFAGPEEIPAEQGAAKSESKRT